MEPVVSIVLLWTAFTATHVGLSSVSLRPRLVALLGAKGFLGAYRRVRGALRITRHPLALGVGLLMALHLIPNASSVDVAFFGGFVLFTLLAAWHQDARKGHEEGEAFQAFLRATPVFPISGRASLVGLREIPGRSWAITVAVGLGLRWLHPTGIWPD